MRFQNRAGAFIGPYWKINDGFAGQFAGTFYRALLDGSTIGFQQYADCASMAWLRLRGYGRSGGLSEDHRFRSFPRRCTPTSAAWRI